LKITSDSLQINHSKELHYLKSAPNKESIVTKIAFVVDDEPANIDLIKGLMPKDVKVKAALSGEIALKQLSKKFPDIVFLDLLMPQMDGFETLKAIRALPQGDSLPVLIISGNASEVDIEKGKALGAIGHLTKPVDSHKLAVFINQYL
jgi:CheY-like chemotaxis protein